MTQNYIQWMKDTYVFDRTPDLSFRRLWRLYRTKVDYDRPVRWTRLEKMCYEDLQDFVETVVLDDVLSDDEFERLDRESEAAREMALARERDEEADYDRDDILP
jgi:hypothetical protein